MKSIPEDVRALFEQLQWNKLFNKRGGTLYRDAYISLRGPGNFYEVLARDLASDDVLVYEVALKALKQKLADVAQLTESL